VTKTDATAIAPLTVLVIGASRGIGRAIAARYVALGHKVVGTHRAGGVPEGVLGVIADVSEAGALDQAVAETLAAHGRIDVLIVAAGITRDGLLLRMSDEDVADVINTNLVGPIRAARAVLRPMIRQRSGSMVFISSISAELGVAGQTNYTAAKGGLNSFARSLAKEYASRGIRVNVVSPGPTDTDMFADTPAEARLDLERAIPLGRLGRTEDVAEVVMDVAGWSWVTGAIVPVAGGLQLGA
jgi:3-oxoacyl-[acyl-carrier protein] reductase